MRRDISEKNNGLLKENSNNQEIQRQTGQRPRTNAEEIPLFVPGNTDKMVKNPLPGPRSREREWRKQHGKRAPVVQKLPPSHPPPPSHPRLSQMNNQRGTGTKKKQTKNLEKLFSSQSSECCRAVRSHQGLSGQAAAGTRGMARSSGLAAAGKPGPSPVKGLRQRLKGFGNAWEPGKSEGRAPCLRPLFLKARSTSPRFVNWGKTQRFCFRLRGLKRQ